VVDVVVDPGVPPDDAELIRESGEALIRMRHGWVPKPRPSRWPPDIGRKARLGAGLVALLGLLFGIGVFSHGGAVMVLLIAGVPLLVMSLVRGDLGGDDRDDQDDQDEQDDDHRDDRDDHSDHSDHDHRDGHSGHDIDREVYERLRPYEGRYVLADDLDPSSRALLDRARESVTAVLGSVVNEEGLLDDVRNGVMLPAHEWEIARLLAKLSSLRARHRETVSQDEGPEIAPEVAAVAEPLARALDSSEAAVVARVEALERYAANVAEAELAYRAHHQIEELRGRLHEYEELVAESGAGGLAVPEITRLAEDAGHLERALRRSVRSAHEAFRYLEP
jgi:hypothetical protein